jgi:valyl-tRNA synthetase
MNPKKAKKIEQQTRKAYPQGIASYGTDALRMTFCALASTSRDINFDLERVEGYRKFCNKLWNATRYVLLQVDQKDCGQNATISHLNIADTWILGRLHESIHTFEKHIQSYRFDLASQNLFQLIKNDYCDWYVELSKPILQNPSIPENEKIATRHTLVNVLEAIMRLLHPMLPFITEELWQHLTPYIALNSNKTQSAPQSIMLSSFPIYDKTYINSSMMKDLYWIQAVINAIRNIRGELSISPSKKIQVYIQTLDSKTKQIDAQRLIEHRPYLLSLAKLDSIEWISNTIKPPFSTAVVDELEILVPLAEFIDLDSEFSRLRKEKKRLEKDNERIAQKLENPHFIDKAPHIVIQKEKEKQLKITHHLNKLNLQIDELTQIALLQSAHKK